MHDRNSYHGHRPTCKRDAAAPGRGQGEIKDLATPAACQERRKNKNKLSPAEIGRLPARSDPALKRDVAALDSSGWFSRYQGCSRQKRLSLSFSLSISPLSFRLSQHLRPRSRAFVPSFRLASFWLLVWWGRAPSSGLWQRGVGGGAASHAEPARSEAFGEEAVFWGGGRQRFTPQCPPHFTPALWYLEAIWP